MDRRASGARRQAIVETDGDVGRVPCPPQAGGVGNAAGAGAAGSGTGGKLSTQLAKRFEKFFLYKTCF